MKTTLTGRRCFNSAAADYTTPDSQMPLLSAQRAPTMVPPTQPRQAGLRSSIKQPINLGGTNEIILRQPIDSVRRVVDDTFSIANFQIGMMIISSNTASHSSSQVIIQ